MIIGASIYDRVTKGRDESAVEVLPRVANDPPGSVRLVFRDWTITLDGCELIAATRAAERAGDGGRAHAN